MKFNLPFPVLTDKQVYTDKTSAIWSIYANQLEVGIITKETKFDNALKRFVPYQYTLEMNFNNTGCTAWLTTRVNGSAFKACFAAKDEGRRFYKDEQAVNEVTQLHIMTRSSFKSRYPNGYRCYETLELNLENNNIGELYDFANIVFNGPVSAIDSRALVLDGYGRDITLALALCYGKALNKGLKYILFDDLETEVNKA